MIWGLYILIVRFLSFVIRLPLFLLSLFYDLFLYIKNREYKNFKYFGLYLYVGQFGGGKTISAVRRAYNLSCKYKNIEILTNVSLNTEYFKCKIIPLNNVDDILTFKPEHGGIVLIDEISTLFNSRDFQKSKSGGMNKQLFQYLAQNRKNKLLFLCTAQLFEHVDRQIKDFIKIVVKCDSQLPGLNFARLTSNTYYNGYDYERARENPVQYPIRPLKFERFIQTNKIRRLYDTFQLIQTLLMADYDDDLTILAKQGRTPVEITQPLGLFDKSKIARAMKNKI